MDFFKLLPQWLPKRKLTSLICLFFPSKWTFICKRSRATAACPAAKDVKLISIITDLIPLLTFSPQCLAVHFSAICFPTPRRARLPAAAEKGRTCPACSLPAPAGAAFHPHGTRDVARVWKCSEVSSNTPPRRSSEYYSALMSTIGIYPLRVSAASSRLPARGEICLKSITFSACLNLRGVYGCVERETLPADTMCPQGHCRWARLGMETRRHGHLSGTLWAASIA